ncbi:MAG TPA: sodium:solute symporter [Bacteroidales bacterium]|nr:sodium:solute symporter [Bacteroidales bacterium]HOU30566.1 sodium:solute symporter [Bacteroidales bacterium]HRR17023.1 sodium:solute symporter [Bacteroidales bacterium]HRT48102.1 sodium:solute symporter [Bacteroidales bacterium]HRU57302.1 sodium:solute symporter [Bacteroidales bacterium]
MATLDWIVLILFCLGLVGIIVWVVKQKTETSADYFLAGRDATWLAIGASIFASNIGSEHLVGLAGAGASSGMAMAHWEMHAWVILILGWVFVPFYSRSKVFTMPEFLEKRYNRGARSFLSVISLVSYVLTKVAVTVYAGGIVFKQVFGIESMFGIDFFWISAVGLVILTGIYTVLGGMKAVLWTSVLQTPVLLLGSIAVLIIGLIKVGGWSEVMEICRAVPVNADGDTMVNLIRSHRDPEFPWTGVILGSAIIGFWYWCTDQYIVQRVLSAKNQKEARRGTIFAGYLKLTPVFIFLIPGMIAYALNQKGLIHLPSSDSAFAVLVKELLPVGFKGLVVGGLLAALMSSLASLFNSSATLFTVDFYKHFRPQASERELVRVGRIATATIVILGVLWIPVMKGLGKVLYAYLQDVQSLLAPGIAAVFLLGIASKKTTPKAGFIGLVTGFVLGMTRLGLNVFKSSLNPESLIYKIFVAPNWLHYECIIFFIIIALMIVVSMVTPKADPGAIKGLYFGSATPEERAITRASWNKWDVINSAIIVSVIVAFYIYFW